jgi:phosphate uptake regulator
MQVIIEDKTVELIALQHPIAKDLRILSTAMKITTDLELLVIIQKKYDQNCQYVRTRYPLINHWLIYR